MAAQRDRARAARAEAQTVGWSDEDSSQLEGIAVTRFEGYEKCSLKTRVAAVLKGKSMVDEAVEGDRVTLILDATPFYAESGGQMGDKGEVRGEGFQVEVTDCIAVQGGRFLHMGLVKIRDRKAGHGGHRRDRYRPKN
jgi:alanyl-tRNA synthetase